MITAEQFKSATGYDPQDDDLERCNCNLRGGSHTMCGWDDDRNMPNFIPSEPLVDEIIAGKTTFFELIRRQQLRASKLNNVTPINTPFLELVP
jgi:hypothetical protein